MTFKADVKDYLKEKKETIEQIKKLDKEIAELELSVSKAIEKRIKIEERIKDYD